MTLFQDEHIAQERQIIRLELVEIDATGHLFTNIAASIPNAARLRLALTPPADDQDREQPCPRVL